MAAGLPVVSSSVGVNKDFVRHNVTGLLADTSEEWAAAIERLASDPGLRQKMGDEGRRRTLNTYSFSATFTLMNTALEKL